MSTPNTDLRVKIAEMVHQAGEGHIPSSYSIVDILDVLYGRVMRYDAQDPAWNGRDYFVLSKGHGSAALFAVLGKYGLLGEDVVASYGQSGSILGGHPDVTRVPHVEASTGSLGHGFPTSVGIALGLRIIGRPNRVFALVGDGECHEGTVWESANIAANRKLGQLTAIVDWNGSAAQLMPRDDLPAKWDAFGWTVREVDGHDLDQIFVALTTPPVADRPTAIIARTTKGMGVSFVEGHGPWHHRIPTDDELAAIRQELTS